jgi:hypothetical protein
MAAVDAVQGQAVDQGVFDHQQPVLLVAAVLHLEMEPQRAGQEAVVGLAALVGGEAASGQPLQRLVEAQVAAGVVQQAQVRGQGHARAGADQLQRRRQQPTAGQQRRHQQQQAPRMQRPARCGCANAVVDRRRVHRG